MDDHDGEPDQAHARPVASPAQTLLVRCWREREGEPGTLRGTVSELSGERLGAFETLAGLVALLTRVLDGGPPD